MNGRLTFITLAVADVSAAAIFYEKLFGWTKTKELATAVFYEMSERTIALFDEGDFSQFVGMPVADKSPNAALFSWNVPAPEVVKEIVSTAETLGAKVARPPSHLDWGGFAAVILTPDGHLWEIVWNPKAGASPAS